MNAIRPLILAAAILALGIAIISCQDSTTDTPLPVPPTSSLAPASHPRAYPPPTSIIQLQKPMLLGPVIPAIVVVPRTMPEPMIRVRLTDEEPSPPYILKSHYHGRIETLKLADGNYVAINVLPIDSYLAGVLKKEMLGSWNAQAFEAQAIASRTFALFQMLTTGPSRQWDVNCDETSQVYAGISAESAKTREAVARTRGEVLTTMVHGQSGIFCAFFSACTGGASQNPSEAWGDPTIPALAARRLGPIDSNCPKYAWPTLRVPKTDISRCIRSWGQRNGLPYLLALGPIKTVTISHRDPATGRPTEFTLTDIHGRSAPIRAEEFRIALLDDPEGAAPRPLSSNFNIVDAGSSIELTNGRGFGHGIGLSQWGAQAMALRGYSHTQILSFYYPTAKLQQLW